MRAARARIATATAAAGEGTKFSTRTKVHVRLESTTRRTYSNTCCINTAVVARLRSILTAMYT